MSEEQGMPLTIGEARLVADQIRQGTWVDTKYWPWVIEQLCDRIESLEKKEESR